MKLPKVLLIPSIDHPIPPGSYGPWELVAYNLAEGLTKLGLEVTLYGTAQTKTNAHLKYFCNGPLDNLDEVDRNTAREMHILEAFKTANVGKYDLVHNLLGFAPLFYSNFISTPMVTTLHGSASEPDKRLLINYFKNKNYISISQAEKKYAPDLNYIGNVYHGVDFSLYTQKSKTPGEYFVFSGRITHEKGIMDAIAFAKQTGIPLKITGIITNQQYFREVVEPKLEEGFIEYVGNLDHQSLDNLMQKAIALLFFIQWDEPFGLSLLDALACGVPVIGYKRGSMSEVIFDSQMGVLVDNLDQAKEVLENYKNSDPAVIRELASKKFSVEAMSQGYLDIYQNLLQKNFLI